MTSSQEFFLLLLRIYSGDLSEVLQNNLETRSNALFSVIPLALVERSITSVIRHWNFLAPKKDPKTKISVADFALYGLQNRINFLCVSIS